MFTRHTPLNIAFNAMMATFGRASAQALLRGTDDPMRSQESALADILSSLAGTEFGQMHGYSEIRGADAFRDRVPICSYEDIRPFIDRQIATGASGIVLKQPILYARTSGTTGRPKYIPVTRAVAQRLRTAQRAMTYFQHEACSPFDGRILAIGGAVEEEMLADGTPAGAVSGMIYRTMPRTLRGKYVLPSEVFDIGDYDLKYAIIARLALQHSDISVMSTANPSTFLRLLEHISTDLPALAAAVGQGACADLDRLPRIQANAVRNVLRAAPERAVELQRLAQTEHPLTLGQLWPNLKAVIAWTGGSCVFAAESVKRMLPPGARMIETGYVASEMRGTVIADVDRSLGLPLFHDVFFEFVPAAQWDEGRRDTLLLHELEAGCDYQIFVTTHGGLCRYHINDVVRITGFISATPTLAFVRKGRGTTNITGEKLTEEQAGLAIRDAANRFALNVPFYLLLADERSSTYRLMIENEQANTLAVAEAIEGELSRLNIEYASKRASGRLGALQVVALKPGTGEAYRRHCLAKGQREAQFKIQALQNLRDCEFDFGPFEALGIS